MNLSQLIRELSRCADCRRSLVIDTYDGDAYPQADGRYLCEVCNEMQGDRLEEIEEEDAE